MADKLPSDELLEVLKQHREKQLQPPPEPPEANWEDEGGALPPEPSGPQKGSESSTWT